MLSSQDKNDVRSEARVLRDLLSASERAKLSQMAAQQFESAVKCQNKCVALFDPIRSEIDASLLRDIVEAQGGRVCLPRTNPDHPLTFITWDEGTPFEDAGFGTRAPVGDNFVVPDILVMPLLAFDAAGNRVGYGQGHYDRTIASMAQKPLLIGYAFHIQQAKHIAAEPHDVPLDMIITDQAVIAVGNKGQK